MAKLENKILPKIELGDTVKITSISSYQTYYELCDEVGIVVSVGSNIGVDFGKVIGSLTWGLDGKLSRKTGRYMSRNAIELINPDWDK